MPLSQRLIDELTPVTPAPETKEEGEDGRGKRLSAQGTPRQRRSAWTRYLREYNFTERPKETQKYLHAWHVGVGLIPTHGFKIFGPKYMMQAIEESQYTWGIIVLVNAYEETIILENTLDFEQRRFPVIVSPTEIEMHSLTLDFTQNSPIGSRTTWATARRTSTSAASAEGLLTARHVPDRCGQNSLWSHETASQYDVYRRASSYVDAVYLEGSWGSVTPAATSAKLMHNMSTGDPFSMDGAYTSTTGFITHLPHKNYRGGGTAAHIFLDRVGQNGDSGALVHENDEPISMYLGKATLKDGTFEGISLALEQVSHDLDVDILI